MLAVVGGGWNTYWVDYQRRQPAVAIEIAALAAYSTAPAPQLVRGGVQRGAAQAWWEMSCCLTKRSTIGLKPSVRLNNT